jgi:uncharacterized repeat protein (TIGR03803 family)
MANSTYSSAHTMVGGIRLAWIFALLIVTLVRAMDAQTLTVLHNFTLTDGGVPVAGLIMDSAGNLYGTASQGGSYGFGTVFELTYGNGGWTFTSLHDFRRGLDGANPVAPVVIGPNGSLYGTTDLGGMCNLTNGGCGTVFNLTYEGMGDWLKTSLYSFPGGDAPDNPDSGVVFDSSGTMYGTAHDGGTGNVGAVYQLTPSGEGWVESVIYNFNAGSDSNACLPTSGVVLDAQGNLYGTASGCGTNGYGSVYMLTRSGTGWTETPLHQFAGGADGEYPYGGLAWDASGNLYGTTWGGPTAPAGTIFQLTNNEGSWIFHTIYSVGGNPSTGAGTTWATLTVDQAGNLYGTTVYGGAYGYGNVFRLSPTEGGWTYTSIYDFQGPFGQAGGYPYSSVTIDASGNLYGTTSTWARDGWGAVWEITP